MLYPLEAAEAAKKALSMASTAPELFTLYQVRLIKESQVVLRRHLGAILTTEQEAPLTIHYSLQAAEAAGKAEIMAFDAAELSRSAHTKSALTAAIKASQAYNQVSSFSKYMCMSQGIVLEEY